MPNAPRLKLSLLDAGSRPIGQACDVLLWSQYTGEHLVARAPKGRSVTITGVKGAPQGTYRLLVDPASYLASGAFVNVAASGETNLSLNFSIDPAKVRGVKFTPFDELPEDTRRVLNDTTSLAALPSLSGAALYEKLDPIRCAGYLNIMCKTEATVLLNGRSVASYISRLTDLRGDRFYAVVPQELRDETKNAAAGDRFESVSSVLHHPPAGYAHAGSFKTPDHYGNLQLTFFTNGTDWSADIDIDDANGLEHVFQVVRNQLSGNPTHPYAIHDLLTWYQKLAPAYEFDV